MAAFRTCQALVKFYNIRINQMTQNISKRSMLMIDAARACLGTPFHHQGRLPGSGLDCIGLVVVALRAVGLEVRDRLDYGVRPDGTSLVAALESHGARRAPDIAMGNILLIRFDHQPQHVALATGPETMIHSFAPAGKVIETTIGPYWQRRILGVYAIDLNDKD